MVEQSTRLFLNLRGFIGGQDRRTRSEGTMIMFGEPPILGLRPPGDVEDDMDDETCATSGRYDEIEGEGHGAVALEVLVLKGPCYDSRFEGIDHEVSP